MKFKKKLTNLSLFWVLQFTGWLLYGIIYYLVFYAHRDLDLANTIGFSITYVVAFLVTLIMRQIYQNMDYHNRSILEVSGVVVVTSIVFAVIWLYVDRFISYPLYEFEEYSEFISKITMRSNVGMIFWNSFILFTWSTLYFLINFWLEWNEQARRLEKAELLAHSAQLKMLRYQLNPHFLFNSLNSIRALIIEDKNKARDMVSELAELLRYSLVSDNKGDVPLSEEITAIKHYFAIEKKRFEDNLQVDFDVNSLAEDYPIPSFLVHPLVENAVKYGMKTSEMPLKISIKANVKDNTLSVLVRNSGKWLREDDPTRSKPSGTGTGLRNVKDRLENRFPGNYELANYEEDGCVVVKIRISRMVEKDNG
jgi:sensor histidine kinase YesM